MTESLIGKVALVTGGSRGIGAATARRLASEGADVAVTYVRAGDRAREVVQDIESLGRRALAIEADSADPSAVVAAVEQTMRHFGRIDILVNNAGIGVFGPLENVTLEEIDHTLAVHVRAAFLAAQAAARSMPRGGRIISIGSCLAQRVPVSGFSLYAMSKSALLGMTRGLARDLGPRGITVNVIEPGPIDTDMNPANGEHSDGERAVTALREYGSPDDVAAMVVHLAGAGGRNVTGAAIAVDGGYAA